VVMELVCLVSGAEFQKGVNRMVGQFPVGAVTRT